MSQNGDCEFCLKFGTSQANDQHWFDRALFAGRDAILVPALGALEVGSVLVVTRCHYPSMRVVPPTTFEQVIRLTDTACDYLRARSLSPIVFEHGAGEEGGGGCITHAHFQIVPTEIDVASAVKNEQGNQLFVQLSSLSELPMSCLGPRGYLLLRDNSGITSVTDRIDVKAQFMRRKIADLTGQSDYWDYLAYPQFERMRATIELFSHFKLP